MANKTFYVRGLRKPDLSPKSISLRVKKTHLQHLDKKKRTSRFYNEQEYLRFLLDLGIQAEKKGEEIEEAIASANKPLPTEALRLKTEVVSEMTEILQASLKQIQDVLTIQIISSTNDLSSSRKDSQEEAAKAEALNKQIAFIRKIGLQVLIQSVFTSRTLEPLTHQILKDDQVISAAKEAALQAPKSLLKKEAADEVI